MSNFGKFPKINFSIFLKSSYFQILFFFRFFFFKAIVNFICKSNFNHFKFSIKTTQSNTSNARACMHKHVAKPYDEFKFNEKIYFPMFYEHKIHKLIILYLFSKEANFMVLQFYPLKMNLVPKIRTTLAKR